MAKKFGILGGFLMGLLMFNSIQLQAQRIQMIDIIGDVDSVTAEFNQKLALTKTKETGKSYLLTGKLGGETSTLELFYTPISKKVYQGTVVKVNPIGLDTLQSTFMKHVSKLVVRYTVPSYFIDAHGNKVQVTPEICSHVSGNKPYMNFPSGVKSVHWENMVYFSNLLLDTRLVGNQIATDYRVINNLTKLDAERALVPAAPKLDF
ncbi:MAG: hypothetical protein RLZZ252_1037 [Bacteroidota bacterium]|jgi:hypothetical protein